MLSTLAPFIFYILGSLCFIIGSVLAALDKLK
jgi:hypothetical protein